MSWLKTYLTEEERVSNLRRKSRSQESARFADTWKCRNEQARNDSVQFLRHVDIALRCFQRAVLHQRLQLKQIHRLRVCRRKPLRRRSWNPYHAPFLPHFGIGLFSASRAASCIRANSSHNNRERLVQGNTRVAEIHSENCQKSAGRSNGNRESWAWIDFAVRQGLRRLDLPASVAGVSIRYSKLVSTVDTNGPEQRRQQNHINSRISLASNEQDEANRSRIPLGPGTRRSLWILILSVGVA